VFYIGGGNILNFYGNHVIYSITDKQQKLLTDTTWASIQHVKKEQEKNSHAYNEQIKKLPRVYTELKLFPQHREVFRIVGRKAPELIFK
jgi:hypothetical protein